MDENLTQDSMFAGLQLDQPLEKELSQSYIDYAMSVIVSRALPDTRDGLKPVIRRILFAMHDMGITADSKHKKSARIVGEVLGKYHPHSDTSVYDAMVRLAQPFSLRYPLVDGQGNFGSIDGDGAAAMRYTEAKLTKIAEKMLVDIEQDTVEWKSNFDDSLQEPRMLPTVFPNHLCNGTMGIAVGMATNMPPHNLTEVVDALFLLLEREGKKDRVEGEEISPVSIDEIMTVIQGPDFPTGGVIFDPNNIREVYRRGKGAIVVRGKVHVEKNKSGDIIVVDEIPYQVNKSSLVAKIGELVIDKRIEGIVDIRDESSKDKIRVAIYLKSGVSPDAVLVQLWKSTDLQTSFHVNNVTLVEDGLQPRMLNIKELLWEFLDFRRVVITRRSQFQLKKAQDRLHILEGLERAISIIDEIIAAIKSSENKAEARQKLMNDFDFSEAQAEYILMMRLQSLVGLEIQKIRDEIEEKRKLIEFLEALLASPALLDAEVVKELEVLKAKFGDERRTDVSTDTSVYQLGKSLKAQLAAADRVEEPVIFWMSDANQIKVLYQSRVLNTPEDTIEMLHTHNQDKLVVITDQGELVVQRLKDFGQFTTQKDSLDLKKHFGLKGAIIFAKTLFVPFEHLVFLTNKNSLKKIDKNLVLGFKKFPTTIMKLEKGEKILAVLPTVETDKIWVLSEQGNLLLFPVDSVRPMGKTAGGVKAIEFVEPGDAVASGFLYRGEPFVLIHGACEAKMLHVDDLQFAKRARRGQIVCENSEKIRGGISIDEGNIRVKLDSGELTTFSSDDVALGLPTKPMKKLTDKKIVRIYRPWEELKSEKEKIEESKNAVGEGNLFEE